MDPPRDNPPPQIYNPLFDQMVSQREQARTSAQVILQLLFQRYVPKSVLDVGCGIGTWLSVAREMGVKVIRGVDGPWLDRSRLIIDADCVSVADLAKPLDLQSRFDLAICLETAEHLPPSAADTLVESLVRHAPVILFSAAVPYQRGPGHVNERWPVYWEEKFARFRYSVLDFLRSSVWHDGRVLWWYRQNTLLLVDFDWCKTQPNLWREMQIQKLHPRPISVVLPDLFFTISKRLYDLEEALVQGGNYTMETDADGSIHLNRTAGPPADGSSPHVTISSRPPKAQPGVDQSKA